MKTQKFTHAALALTALLAAPALAQTSFECKPKSQDGFFTEAMRLEVVNSNRIELGRIKLDLDKSFKPKSSALKGYSRFKGDTALATGWADSGEVEVLLKKKSAKERELKIRVRGEGFVSEDLGCKRK